MTTAIKRKPCVRCDTGRGIATCNGCHETFCVNHFIEHREGLSQLMDNVSEKYDSFRSNLCPENFEHPLLSRIDIWEQESIKRIQITAKTARKKLQEIFKRKNDEAQSSLEKLTQELQSSRTSADYTEIDINKWTEQIKTIREEFENWSHVDIEYDGRDESVFRLITICDQQEQLSLQTVQLHQQSARILEKSFFFPDEKFDEVNEEIILSEEDLVATCQSKLIFSNRFIYGVNRYSSGKHEVNFCIQKKTEAPLFFGIITSSKKYSQSLFSSNNSSVYGWWDFQSVVTGGKLQAYTGENLVTTGDEMTLTLDCDDRQILLRNCRTKQYFQIFISIEKCPFPWKIIIGLSSLNDSIRIMH